MRLESEIIERVEMFIRHPIYEGSDEVMADVLGDLLSRAGAREISQSTYQTLRERILRSPHFGRDDRSSMSRAS